MRQINIRSLRQRNILIIIITILLIISIITGISLYIFNKDVRDWIDIYILRKNLTESDIEFINLNAEKPNQIYAYGKNIVVLNDKTANIYNIYGESTTSIDLNINSAIFDSSNKYLAIAENGGKELCLILDKTYLWGETTDSEILQINVNRNGYVAVVTTDVTHKSILTLYNAEGKKIFTRYFATNRIVDISISNDNKYIAVAELDSSGALIQSLVEIISIENAKKDVENTIIYSQNAEIGRMISNIEYQDNNEVTCIYDDGINIIKNNIDKSILKISDDSIVYLSNQLKNNIVYVEEKADGVFKVTSKVNIVNTLNEKKVEYDLYDTVKEIYTNENIIAVNAGTEIYFINTGGWLVKKYTAKQEITNVKVSGEIATIIYKDKIEIINL